MRKSEAAKKILPILKNWAGSQPSMEMAREIVDALEKIEVQPSKSIPSGCLHSMREMCNCQTTYEIGYEEDRWPPKK